MVIWDSGKTIKKQEAYKQTPQPSTHSLFAAAERRKPIGCQRFAAALPYASVIVELDEAKGALLAGNLLDVPYTEAKVGRRVEVVFEKLNDDITLPQFRLVSE